MNEKPISLVHVSSLNSFAESVDFYAFSGHCDSRVQMYGSIPPIHFGILLNVLYMISALLMKRHWVQALFSM